MAALMVRDLPEDERPRERLLQDGAGSLSDVELVAILLRTGTKESSVLRVSEEVLSLYRDKGLQAILHMTAKELSSIHGVGTAKAATLLAAVELGRRLTKKAAREIRTITSPEDAVYYTMHAFLHEEREKFLVIFLNVKNHILGMREIAAGGLAAVALHPRDVFRIALKENAAHIILLHNHPSGDPTPSAEDETLTYRMAEGGALLGITVLDHIVVGGGDNFVSLKNLRPALWRSAGNKLHM